MSGLPSADMNMALIHAADDRALKEVVDRIGALGCPTLLMFAGEATNLAGELPADWTTVGAMPILTVDLARTQTVPDARVRRARPADAAKVSWLMSEAYGIDREHVDVVIARLVGGELLAELWLLEDSGDAVSTVVSARVDDTVSLWCMATPPQRVSELLCVGPGLVGCWVSRGVCLRSGSLGRVARRSSCMPFATFARI